MDVRAITYLSHREKAIRKLMELTGTALTRNGFRKKRFQV